MLGRSAGCVITLLAVGIGAPEAVNAQTVWRYMHPESKIVVGVEWRRVASSKLGRELRASISKVDAQGMSGLNQLNLLDSADRILFSAAVASGAKPATPTKGLVALEGRFDWAKLRAAILASGARAETVGGKEMLIAKNSGDVDGVFTLAEPGILVAGDQKSVMAALSGVTLPESAPLYRRATALAAHNDVWFTGAVPPDAIPAQAGPQAQMLADVTGFDFGLNLRRGMGLELNVETKSEQAASTVAGGLRLLVSMAAMQQQNNPEMATLAEKIQIATSRSDVRMSLHLDENDLDKSFRSLHAALPGGMKPVQVRAVYKGDKTIIGPTAELGATAAATAVAEAPKPPERQVVKIYGAEGGTREIQLGNQ